MMHLAIKVILDVMDYGTMCLLEPGSLLDAAESGAQDYICSLSCNIHILPQRSGASQTGKELHTVLCSEMTQQE